MATKSPGQPAIKRASTSAPARPLDRASAHEPVAHPLVVMAVAWILPGAGHLWQGRRQKGLVFLLALPAMFAVGLWLGGRLFPFEPSQPLVALSALANLGLGIPYFVASAMDAGQGLVTAASYEYGNAFLIASGLMNMLVVLDAYDVALGRK